MPLKLRNLAIVPLLGAALALTACSNDANESTPRIELSKTTQPAATEAPKSEGTRPSAAEIGEGFLNIADESGIFDSVDPAKLEAFATCVGEELYDSEISDEALEAVATVDAQGLASISPEENELYTEISSKAGATCSSNLM